MLTASHNPPAYLGVKFKEASGGPIAQEEAKAIEALVPEEACPREGSWEETDLRELYYEALARRVDLKALARFPGTLYHDSMGGAGAGFLQGFFHHVGLEIPLRPLREVYHPLFHGVNPEPIPKNLGVTQTVLSVEAPPTFAVATDGDADRVGVVLAGVLPGGWRYPALALAGVGVYGWTGLLLPLGTWAAETVGLERGGRFQGMDAPALVYGGVLLLRNMLLGVWG
jgi:phosphomannomutase